MKARMAGFMAVCALGAPAAAQAQDDGPARAGRAFVPAPASKPTFTYSESSVVTHDVATGDVATIHTKTFLPVGATGRLPVVLIYTPYETTSDTVAGTALIAAGGGAAAVSGEPAPPPEGAYHHIVAEYFVRRGYAVTIASARGTGASGGCMDYLGATERDDIARVIEWLGTQAWSSGRVGMYGFSYDATAQIAVAGHSDTSRTKYLKAIVPIAGVTSGYDLGNSDGVPFNVFGFPLSTAAMMLWQGPDAPKVEDRYGCQADHTTGTAPSAASGDFDPWYAEREYRAGAPGVRAATLMSQGFLDDTVFPNSPLGFFNRIPKTTPKALVLPQIGHAVPDYNAEKAWRREDWLDMVTAWYDRYLKKLEVDVANWPAVQVQSAATGQWHTESTWPPANAPELGLALRRDGTLGASDTVGKVPYSEDSVHPAADNATDNGRGAAIWTYTTDTPLHISGQPRLKLWVALDRPDAHIVANLQAFAKDGTALLGLASDGRRSARHLDPIVDDRFVQADGKAPPAGAFEVAIRFMPIDAVVPAGGTIRLSLAGVNPNPWFNSAPSEQHATVSVLTGCPQQSVLWLSMPSKQAELLNVRDSESGELASTPERVPTSASAGVAPSCG